MAGAAVAPCTTLGLQDELDQRVAAPEDVADVAPHRADRRGHDADPARPARDRRACGRRRRGPRRPAAARSCSYRACRSPAPGGRDRLDVELVDALRLVGADAAVDDDLHPVHGAHRRAGQLLAEERRPDLAVGVLQGEEAVAGRRERGLADLALDPDVGEDRIGVEEAANPAVEVGDAQDARRCAHGRRGAHRLRSALAAGGPRATAAQVPTGSAHFQGRPTDGAWPPDVRLQPWQRTPTALVVMRQRWHPRAPTRPGDVLAVRVSIRSRSPSFTNSGTCTTSPVSSVAGLLRAGGGVAGEAGIGLGHLQVDGHRQLDAQHLALVRVVRRRRCSP